jgi:uncharacterized protein
MMIPRAARSTLLRLTAGFPVVAMTGPRQSGKTTLAREAFPGKPYVSLEAPDEREFAATDPKRFLARFPQGAVLDEVQRVPDLFSWLQGHVDERRLMGDFILTGSQQFGLTAALTQSLAGRAGRLELLPFSAQELLHAQQLPASLESTLWQGGYPALYDRPVSPSDWLASYVATYLERDVRQLLRVRDLALFQRFVRLCAARSGQLLNLAALAADCGVSNVTASEWLGVLEASYLVIRVPPYFQNFGKRLVKAPKLYFLDTGLLCWLLGLREADQLLTHASRGAVFETWVVSEWAKHQTQKGEPLNLYHWRDSNGLEVDLVLETPQGLQAVEIKSGTTFASDWASGLKRWLATTQSPLKPWVVYGGDASSDRRDCRALAWRDVAHGPL